MWSNPMKWSILGNVLPKCNAWWITILTTWCFRGSDYDEHRTSTCFRGVRKWKDTGPKSGTSKTAISFPENTLKWKKRGVRLETDGKGLVEPCCKYICRCNWWRCCKSPTLQSLWKLGLYGVSPPHKVSGELEKTIAPFDGMFTAELHLFLLSMQTNTPLCWACGVYILYIYTRMLSIVSKKNRWSS